MLNRNIYINLILITLLILSGVISYAQCPNANFEFGDFTNWTGKRGTWKGIDREPEIIFGHVTVVR